MSVITISVEDTVENRFRKHAGEVFGVRKGYLGAAVTAAMKKWIEEHENEEVAHAALHCLEKGFVMGKLLYKERAELHER